MPALPVLALAFCGRLTIGNSDAPSTQGPEPASINARAQERAALNLKVAQMTQGAPISPQSTQYHLPSPIDLHFARPRPSRPAAPQRSTSPSTSAQGRRRPGRGHRARLRGTAGAPRGPCPSPPGPSSARSGASGSPRGSATGETALQVSLPSSGWTEIARSWPSSMWVAWVGGAAQAGAGLVWARGLAVQGPGTGARRVQCVEGEGM